MLMRSFYPLTGGYETQSLQLALEMRLHQIDVRVVTQRRRQLPGFEIYRGIPIHRIAARGRGHASAIVYLLSSLFWLSRHRREYSVIHANRLSSGVVAGVVGRILGKKVVCRLTSADEVSRLRHKSSLWGWLRFVALRRCVDRFVALNPQMEVDLRSVGIPADRIVGIPNAVELPPPGTTPRRNAAPVVLFVGRLAPEKGVACLLDAWSRVAAEEPRARLVIVGDGPERPSLEARCAALGLTTVSFAGRQRDVEPFLSSAAVFALPSRREGASNALLEAMSRGLPAVVADDPFGANRQLVTDGIEGIVVAVEDPRALGEALLRLLRDPALRAELGSCARRRIEERPSVAEVAVRYTRLYGELLGQHFAPPDARGAGS